MEDDFTAQAQHFVRSAVFCAVTLGLAFGENGVFGVLDVAVTVGFAFQGVASKLCVRDAILVRSLGGRCRQSRTPPTTYTPKLHAVEGHQQEGRSSPVIPE